MNPLEKKPKRLFHIPKYEVPKVNFKRKSEKLLLKSKIKSILKKFIRQIKKFIENIKPITREFDPGSG